MIAKTIKEVKMRDTILYRRFILVALFIAAIGILMASLIQETRTTDRAFAPAIERFHDCGSGRMCEVKSASFNSYWS